jgi:hypothetical protein
MRKDGVTEYIIGKKEDILNFIEIVNPYLILKKKQIILLKQILKQKELVVNIQDFEAILQLCNSFQDLNYSKKRKIRTLCP